VQQSHTPIPDDQLEHHPATVRLVALVLPRRWGLDHPFAGNYQQRLAQVSLTKALSAAVLHDLEGNKYFSHGLRLGGVCPPPSGCMPHTPPRAPKSEG
jgi:hypothetical protein